MQTALQASSEDSAAASSAEQGQSDEQSEPELRTQPIDAAAAA